MEKIFCARHYSHGSLDLCTGHYRCLIRSGEGLLHLYGRGSRYADLIFVPDAGVSPEPGPFQLELEREDFCGETDRLKLVCRCGDSVRSEITFFPDRIEFKAERTGGAPILPEAFHLGRGSKLFSDKLFTPGWPDRTLPIGHYLRRQEPIQLSPGLMSPPPWCFAAQQENGRWMGFELEPEEEEFDFYEFDSVPGRDHEFCWSVGYGGCKAACSRLSAPALVLRFDLEDEYEVFRRHAETIVETGRFRPVVRSSPSWHRGVALCGWRFQGSRQDFCTQANYEEHIAYFQEQGIDFDTVILDDFWGDPRRHGIWKCDETRWPDLRGFVEKRHAEGRHVLLWVCTYGSGLPEEELLDGTMQNLDSPAWRRRLREDAHRMLSADPGCYNADGIKYDFTALLPRKPGCCSVCGVGYLRERFRVVYEAMTAVKPEALILCQSVNPYFTPWQSMIRLNDFTALPCHGLEEMRIRSRIAQASGYGLPVDPDHVSFGAFSYRGGYDFFREMESLGIVSLYLNREDLADPEFREILRALVRRNILRHRS